MCWEPRTRFINLGNDKFRLLYEAQKAPGRSQNRADHMWERPGPSSERQISSALRDNDPCGRYGMLILGACFACCGI